MQAYMYTYMYTYILAAWSIIEIDFFVPMHHLFYPFNCKLLEYFCVNMRFPCALSLCAMYACGYVWVDKCIIAVFQSLIKRVRTSLCISVSLLYALLPHFALVCLHVCKQLSSGRYKNIDIWVLIKLSLTEWLTAYR